MKINLIQNKIDKLFIDLRETVQNICKAVRNEQTSVDVNGHECRRSRVHKTEIQQKFFHFSRQ